LIETGEDVAKLEKAVEELDGKLTAARAELAKVKAEAKPKPEEKKSEKPVQEVGSGKPSGSWW